MEFSNYFTLYCSLEIELNCTSDSGNKKNIDIIKADVLVPTKHIKLAHKVEFSLNSNLTIVTLQ